MQTYTLTGKTINNPKELERFFLNYLPKITRYNSLTYNSTTKVLTIYTKELVYSLQTAAIFNDLVNNKFPNLPADVDEDWDVNDVEILKPITGSGTVVESESVYGYFPVTTAVDGDIIMTKNASLTRNMYYKNLTINAGVNLNANGWRIVVTDTLTLNGIISNDGGNASGAVAGTGTSTPFTTYLGPGTSGGAALTATGAGNPGVPALYACCGGAGGNGGKAASNDGGNGGSFTPIAAVDGGINTLSTMPVAFLGRMVTSNYYLQGGTGGGSGGAYKSSATKITSGSGGGAGGLIVLAARTLLGTGSITAKGGNGSVGSYTGTLPANGGAGGGGGGGGGCLIVITQSGIPDAISLNVDGGSGGAGLNIGTSGSPGSAGNIFKIKV